MASNQRLIEVNERFYRAFRDADLEAMERLWARCVEVACAHPGWPALRGRERVMASWRAVMVDHPPPRVECARVEVFDYGSMAFVTCVERVPEVHSELVATNIFVEEDGEWRLVHHHSGPTRMAPDLSPPPDDDDEEPTTLN